MSDEQPLLQACPNCATLLDISEEEPFAQVHCPICGTAMRVRRQFNNFSLEEVLGAGGMGAVYKALDLNLDRLVALKLLRREFSSNTDFISKFEMEARITASITHPHVVKVFSFGSDHGIYYIAMELVDKGSLDDLMGIQGRVAEAQALDVGMQIAQGLNAALQRGLIHRDVKPGNILFSDAHTAKIVDFGLAVLMEQQEQAAEARGEVWGTPYYIAPEKLDHQPEDLRSDIYSLGGTLFHAIAGRPPFEAQTASLVALKHLKSQAVSLQAFAPDVSTPTAYVINRMLSKEPGDRYQSYDELVEHLDYARNKLLEKSAAPHKKERVVIESARSQQVMGWLSFLMVAMVAAVGILAWTYRDTFLDRSEKAHAEQQRETEETRSEYDKARQTLLEGDFASAREHFRKLAEQEGAAQPLRSWMVFHEGLAAFLSGQLSEGRDVFKQLYEADLFSTDPKHELLANFFVETGRLASSREPLPAGIRQNYSAENVEALSLLVFALKNWEMGEFDEAGPLFRAFGDARPEPPHQWIEGYKRLAQPYRRDFASYERITIRIRSAGTPAEEAAALEELRKLKQESEFTPKMAERLDELERELQKKVSSSAEAAGAEAARRAAEQKQIDTARWQAAMAEHHQLVAEFEIERARSVIEAAAASDPELILEKEILLKKTGWLLAFKSWLVAEINARGFSERLMRKSGQPVAGALSGANERVVEMKNPYGTTTLAWRELTRESILTMARHYMNELPEGPRMAEAMWCAGVFAFMTGMDSQGGSLVVEASQSDPRLADHLGLFFEETGGH